MNNNNKKKHCGPLEVHNVSCLIDRVFPWQSVTECNVHRHVMN